MWRRQCCVGGDAGGRCGVWLRCALASPRQQQVCHASQGKRHLDTPGRRTNYYDVLQLSPKATQAQVKDAYYNLSKKYHPDQYRGEEDPAKKFREIKEAYEVLGNFHQRKMYDRGLLGVTVAATPTEAKEFSKKFYEARYSRGHAPTGTGRTPIYDFDEWSKVHYQNVREKRGRAKQRYEELVRDRVIDQEVKRTQSVVSILTLLGLCLFLYSIMPASYDTDRMKKSHANSNKNTR